jgi:hypothetical protein
MAFLDNDGQIQINGNATATNNFVFQTDNAGGIKLSRGNAGATTQDILYIDASGNISFPSQTVNASTTNTVTNKIPIVINGVTYYLLASTSAA